MKKIQSIKYFLMALFLMISSLTFAAPSPVDMLQQTSNQMLSTLKTSARDTTSIYSIIRKILLPHVELDVMSRLVVGNSYWKQATPEQKQQFKDQFTRLVTRMYSSALSSYKDEKVKFLPVRESTTNNRVQVNSEIQRGDGSTIAVKYRLILGNDDQWKVYDFSVENVSMVNSYRSQFAPILQKQGFNGLLQRMRTRNAG